MKRKIIIWICIITTIIVVSNLPIVFLHRQSQLIAAMPRIQIILDEAKKKIDGFDDWSGAKQRDTGRTLAILAIAEQLGRIADALENK